MSVYGFGQMIEKLKASPKTIVLTEGSDPRILEAASRLLASNFLKPILLGNPEEIAKAMKIPVGTVKSRLNTARKQLKERMEVAGYD